MSHGYQSAELVEEYQGFQLLKYTDGFISVKRGKDYLSRSAGRGVFLTTDEGLRSVFYGTETPKRYIDEITSKESNT